ncbi:MAG: hypothetical protein V3T42_01000 [Nitrospirales bacterium]
MKNSVDTNLNRDAVLDEFWQLVFQTYGTYCDGFTAFNTLHKKLENDEREMRERAKGEPIIIESFSYGRMVRASMKDQQRERVLPQFDYEDVKARNKIGGRNYYYIGNMCVVTIYQYWEDHYREELANAMNLKTKNCIFSDIFGDFADLRRCIIHTGCKANKKIPRSSEKTWFQENDDIRINRDIFENLIDGIHEFVTEFRANPENFIRSC